MNSTATIFARITGASGIVSRLDSYKGGPAVFSDRAPDKFKITKPVIIIAAPFEDADAGTFSETVRATAQDVRIYAPDTGSTAEIDELARDIRDLFHLQASALTVTGGQVNTATATGPVQAPTSDPSIIGRRVTVRLELQRT